MEFLNALSAAQQVNMTNATTVNAFMGPSAPNNYCTGIQCKTAPNVGGDVAGVYACNLDNDAVDNEDASDGKYNACYCNNGGSGGYKWHLAYLDWSGLRPMTELEFEKACRGPMNPVPDEFAWGTTAIRSWTSFTNIGGINEVPSGGYTESSTTGTTAYRSVSGYFIPVRCGIFATASSTRIISGASYYGIMELSGSVFETTVAVGSVAGRSYTGNHGDGTLTSTGYANVDYWPGINGNSNRAVANVVFGGVTGCTDYAGIGGRGGGSYDPPWSPPSGFMPLRVSARYVATNNNQYSIGFRGVRTAP